MFIKVGPFRAEIPRLSEELLPQNNAQIARNCRLQSGKLEAWRDTRRVYRPSKTGTKLSIYRWGAQPGAGAEGAISSVQNTTPVRIVSNGHGRASGDRVFISGTGLAIDNETYTITVIDANTFSLNGVGASGTASTGQWTKQNGFWFHWTQDVDVVRSPIIGDTTERTYFTGDGVPRVTDSSLATAGGGTNYPTNAYNLGVPAPSSPIGSVQAIVNSGSIAAITLANPVVIRTTAAHGLQKGDLVFLQGILGTTELNGNTYTVEIIDNDEFSLAGVNGTSFGAYTGGGIWEERFDSADISTRVYVYTYVSAWGEEGAPSLPSATVNAGPGQTVQLNGMAVGPTGNFNVTLKRIYRAVTGAAGSAFLFVAEIPVAQQNYTDSLTEAQLGEPLQSENWDMPPSDMFGLVALANGVVIGLSKNQVCPSVPYQPHAYPVNWRQGTDFPVVALGVFHTTAVVLTRGHPYLLVGNDPASMTLVKIENHQSCVSKRGVRSLHQYGVVYPSPDGLVRIGPGGDWDIVTAGLMTRREWQALRPESIHAYVVDGRYLAFYDNGTPGAFLFDPAEPERGLVFFDIYATAGFMDLMTDSLYLQIGDYIERFDSGTGLLTYLWRSRKFREGRARRYTAGKVVADSYANLTMNVYAGGKLRHSERVRSVEAFRIGDPDDDGSANAWEIEITGTDAVSFIGIAETRSELETV